VVAAAFTLSFFALRDAAQDPALAWGSGHAWLFPIGVDTALLFFEVLLLLGASRVPIRQWCSPPSRPAGHADGQAARRRAGPSWPSAQPRTIQTALGELEAARLAAGSEEGSGRARYWPPHRQPQRRRW
jgi:Protein of unknown function (DUF2637)